VSTLTHRMAANEVPTRQERDTPMTTPGLNAKHMSFKQLIGGDWVGAASGATFDRVSPTDGTIVGTYPNSDAQDAQRALEAARHAFDTTSWSTSGRERSRVLRRAAALFEEHAEDLISRCSLEEGTPRGVAAGTLGYGVGQTDIVAAKALLLRGEAISQEVPDGLGLVLTEAVGVVSTIIPFNVSLSLASKRISTALAAGCAVVVKPSPLASGSTLLLAQLYAEAGVPDGILNVVTSDIEGGTVVGKHLVSSPLTDMVSFTGSTATGRIIMRDAAANLTNVSLELGGKAPQIILPDAPIDVAVQAVALGAFMNAGQVCAAGTRLLVSRAVKDEFLEKLCAKADALVIGDPLKETTTLGPVISETQLRRIEHYLELGHEAGNAIRGGSLATSGDLAKGHFVEPTIFDEVGPQAAIAREEIFGPVLSVVPFDDPSEVLAIANDTEYGLTAGIWSRNITTALNLAKGIRAGTVFVNSYFSTGLPDVEALDGGSMRGLGDMPEGGYKRSGINRDVLEDYLETKSVHISLADALQ
jgi:acyl-CoA reductase-like NAD-dependent aldehyde dehydrogenase